jgi:hypothetical protein
VKRSSESVTFRKLSQLSQEVNRLNNILTSGDHTVHGIEPMQAHQARDIVSAQQPVGNSSRDSATPSFPSAVTGQAALPTPDVSSQTHTQPSGATSSPSYCLGEVALEEGAASRLFHLWVNCDRARSALTVI